MTASGSKAARRRPTSSARPPEAGEGSWDHVASWYDTLAGDRGTEFHETVIVPGVIRLLDLQRGESVLDLACGQGVMSRTLHRRGGRVTAVDISPQLIEIAQGRSSKGIRYQVGDVRDLSFLGDDTFDAAVCVLAAQNIEPMEPLFMGSARHLRPWGRMVVVVSHPAFRIPRQSSWQWDETRKLLFRAVDRYLSPLKIPIDMRPFQRPGQELTWTYHRPLQAYVTALAAARLWINAVEEWPSPKVSQPGRTARGENRARAEFPLFLAIRAVLVPPQSSDR